MSDVPTPDVSVIIPVYNDITGLMNCLRWLAELDPSSPSFEVVVVDNGSTPPIRVESEFPFELKLVRDAQTGSYAARNAGVATASGACLVFIDADCWPEPDWLSRGVRTLRKHRGGCIVGGDVRLTRPSKPSSVALYQLATGFGQETNVREKAFSATANLFCTREQFDRVGPFETRLLSGGDREWCWRAYRRGIDVVFEPRAIVHTMPRVTLRGAIVQARRVVAGRRMLKRLNLSHAGGHAVKKLRSPAQSVLWLLGRNEFTWVERIRMLGAAVLIRVASSVEAVKLAVGTSAERR